MQMHWCMAVIFMTEKRIQYYDSMHGSGAGCLKVLLRQVVVCSVLVNQLAPVGCLADAVCPLYRYLHDESEHKKKQKFDDQGWELVTTAPDTPLQTNGSDCGVFSCMFADYLSQNMVCYFALVIFRLPPN